MKSAERRDAIVRSAIHLFAEKGFRGATTRELAAAAGVTEPVLYQHFRTKGDLYSAIIEAKAGEVSGHAAELRQLAQSGDDRAFFRMVGEVILRRYETDPELSRLVFFSSLERHELSDLFFERLYAGFNKLLTGCIRRRFARGDFCQVNAEIAARGLIGMISITDWWRCSFWNASMSATATASSTEMVSVYLGGISSNSNSRK
jgi:AcrR family transcriptional regulator